MDNFQTQGYLRIFIIIILLFTISGCSIFGAIFSLFGDIFSWGLENLPRYLPYLLFLVERQDIPEDEQIYLAGNGGDSKDPALPASTTIATHVELNRDGIEMVVAIPFNSLSEERKAKLLEKLKEKKIRVFNVNASDLIDQVVPNKKFGEALAKAKVTFVGSTEFSKIANSSYKPEEQSSQKTVKEIKELLDSWEEKSTTNTLQTQESK